MRPHPIELKRHDLIDLHVANIHYYSVVKKDLTNVLLACFWLRLLVFSFTPPSTRRRFSYIYRFVLEYVRYIQARR